MRDCLLYRLETGITSTLPKSTSLHWTSEMAESPSVRNRPRPWDEFQRSAVGRSITSRLSSSNKAFQRPYVAREVLTTFSNAYRIPLDRSIQVELYSDEEDDD
jgi:hypothetical protein